jgi:hypothetical protein
MRQQPPHFKEKKSVLIYCALMYSLQVNIFCSKIGAVLNTKMPFQRRAISNPNIPLDHKMPQTALIAEAFFF